MSIIPKRVPASKDLIRAAPFSNNNWMLFSFWRLMFSMVKKVKIGSRTATAPIKTQGGTPIQDFIFLVLLVINSFKSKNKAKKKMPKMPKLPKMH
jgi:hypothetical protein